jgi:iron complex transport system ATP-binding protein
VCFEVANGLNPKLDGGELVALLGPNDAGKSTLLRTLAGLQKPLGGRVELFGEDLQNLTAKERARRLAVLLPGRPRDPHLTARELVALGRQPHTGWWGGLGEVDLDKIDAALATVDATDLAHRPVVELSDGESQKISIARALAQEARVVLLDEPTAFLDLPHRVQLLRRLRDLTRQTGQAILFSSHDLDLALRSADRLWLLSADGRLRMGAPEDLVLDGSLHDTFRHEGVSFDPESGSFRLESTSRAEVEMHGEGLPALWTRRALRRIGLREGAGSSLPQILIEEQQGRPRWTLRRGTEHCHCDTILELLQELEKGRWISRAR